MRLAVTIGVLAHMKGPVKLAHFFCAKKMDVPVLILPSARVVRYKHGLVAVFLPLTLFKGALNWQPGKDFSHHLTSE
jgi:hypothetical protein